MQHFLIATLILQPLYKLRRVNNSASSLCKSISNLISYPWFHTAQALQLHKVNENRGSVFISHGMVLARLQQPAQDIIMQ